MDDDDQFLYDRDAITEQGGDPDDPAEHAAMQRVSDILAQAGRRAGVRD